MSPMIQAPQKRPQPLIAHPVCDVPAGWRVNVSLWRDLTAGQIKIRFVMPRVGVHWPAIPTVTTLPSRADELWKHSCVELFVGKRGDDHYREFNFSIDGRWAAYDFSGYREPILQLPSIPPPQLSMEVTENTICVLVSLSSECVQGGSDLEMNAAAVLESDTGLLSYWTATHPCTQPDFHHRAGFVLTFA